MPALGVIPFIDYPHPLGAIIAGLPRAANSAASRSAGLSRRRPVTRDSGIGLSLERPYPIQPVQIGMTDEQPGLQRIQIGAVSSPLFQRR